MNIVMSLDGVIRSDTGDLIPSGLIVYRGFHSLGRVVLLTELDRVRAEAWCVLHNLADYDDLIDGSVAIDPEEPLRLRQIHVARSRGTVDFYLDADPVWVAKAFSMGMTALLFSHPSYARPEFRPDAPKGVRPWDELLAERTRQQAMIATDRRLNKDELVTFE
jgi:hypothetical protein